ncbi:hypothetical protein ACFWFU_04465 [Streptomyces sp. NPDC060235]|uniref:hypothetical protein n=1 Tax=Streptomyces sp. NPDC060235 TaxID=3347080 RepID=UPI003658686B
MTEELLGQAKEFYQQSKQEYADLRPALTAHTDGPLSRLFSDRTVEEEFNNVGNDLVFVIGLLLTSPPGAGGVLWRRVTCSLSPFAPT